VACHGRRALDIAGVRENDTANGNARLENQGSTAVLGKARDLDERATLMRKMSGTAGVVRKRGMVRRHPADRVALARG
jgi:hypothetical protein